MNYIMEKYPAPLLGAFINCKWVQFKARISVKNLGFVETLITLYGLIFQRKFF